MEGGALSSKDFPKFAEKVVPFLHITTRIPGHPYDKLLTEKGGTGFPTLMFLDDQGRKLQRHSGDRSAKGFDKSLEEVREFMKEIEKAEAGDKRLAGKVFVRQLELEWFSFEEATERYAKLGKVSSKDKKRIEPLLIDAEVRTHANAAGKDATKRQAAGAHFSEMLAKKRLPTAQRQEYQFWSLMADHAEAEGDKKLLRKVVKGFKDSSAGKSSRYRRVLKSFEQRLKDL